MPDRLHCRQPRCPRQGRGRQAHAVGGAGGCGHPGGNRDGCGGGTRRGHDSVGERLAGQRLMGRGASVGLLRRVLHMRVLACVCGGGAGARKVPWLPGEAQVPA